MYAKLEHLRLKKTPAGESGLSECVPPHLPGTVNSDPAGAYYMTYHEQLKSPKWQKRRLEALESSGYTCSFCRSTEKQLHVHHTFYDSKRMIWEYDELELIVLCADCHKEWHTMIPKIMTQIALNIMNVHNGMTLSKLYTLLYYYPEDKEIFDYIYQKALQRLSDE